MSRYLSGAEPPARTLARFLALDVTIARRRGRDEPGHQFLRGTRDLLDRAFESILIDLRGTRAPAHLAHVLQRGVVHFLGRGRRVEIEQRADVAAHGRALRPDVPSGKSAR